MEPTAGDAKFYRLKKVLSQENALAFDHHALLLQLYEFYREFRQQPYQVKDASSFKMENLENDDY